MTQEEVLAVVNKYKSGALMSDIKKECINPGDSLRVLYKHREISRIKEGKDFRYFINK